MPGPLFEWRPTAGVDYETSELALGVPKCADARNMLFERNMARCRPHARREESIYQQGAKVDFAKTFLLEGRNRYRIYLQGDTLRRLGCAECETAHAAAAITGSAPAMGDREYHNAIAVNGNIIVGNAVNGALHHTPLSTTSYTLLTDAKYRYFSSSFSRAVAAYDIASGSEDARKFAWSVTGDETDWTNTGSGTSTLSDIPDGITGLANIANVIVILRQTGISLAYVTGNSSSGPFRFELAVRDGAGCPWPSTVDQFNNLLYYVGPDNCYTYTLGDAPKPFGDAIRDQLLRHLALGARFRGVVTKGDFQYEAGAESPDGVKNSFRPRLRYHLVPMGAYPSNPPHYCFDVKQGSWSAHAYSFSPRVAYESVRSVDNQPIYQLSFVDDTTAPQNISWWDGASGSRYESAALPTGWPDDLPDQEHRLVSGVYSMGEEDVEIQRILMEWSLDANYPVAVDFPPVKMTLAYKEKYRQRSVESTAALGDLDASRTWNQTWFDIRATGNEFQLFLSVPAGLKVKIGRVLCIGKNFAESRNRNAD